MLLTTPTLPKPYHWTENTESLQIEHLPSKQRIRIQGQIDDQQLSWEVAYQESGKSVEILGGFDSIDSSVQVYRTHDAVFSLTKASELRLADSVRLELPEMEYSRWQEDDNGLYLSRAAFYQFSELWLNPALVPVMPDIRSLQEGISVTVPQRPRIPDAVLYRRFIPGLGEEFSLRRADISQDGARFHRWQNDPRVAAFWEYPFSREKLDQYLSDRLDDPHCEPLIASFNGEPFGYIETYWALEDRLGPYYDARAFDHGAHILVGERKYLGSVRSTHWINALSHYLFLLDCRTDRLVGEPRADNVRLLKLLDRTAWYKQKEFDFPHKRAALIQCDKAEFFSQTIL